MYVPEYLTKPRNLMNGALVVLPSGLALFMFGRLFNQNFYYTALLRTALIAAFFIGISIYISGGAQSETSTSNKVYVKKASIFKLDGFGYKTRLLLAFISINAVLLLATAAPAMLQASGVIENITNFGLSGYGNMIFSFLWAGVGDNVLTSSLADFVVLVRHFIDLVVYVFIILLG